jgi:hypothetical protein
MGANRRNRSGGDRRHFSRGTRPGLSGVCVIAARHGQATVCRRDHHGLEGGGPRKDVSLIDVMARLIALPSAFGLQTGRGRALATGLDDHRGL